jgi:hypothetical protein
MNPSENISKKKLDFSNKIRYFQASPEPHPKFRKIWESPFNFLCRSLSAIAA